MKNYTILVLLLLLLPFGCKQNSRNITKLQSEVIEENKTVEDSLEYQSSKEHLNSPLAKNLVRALRDSLRVQYEGESLDFSEHKLHIWDTINGDFNGDGHKESAHIFEYSASGYNGYGVGAAGVVFSDESIPFFIVRQPFFVFRILNEDDLTGDTADEIGFCACGAFSGWGVWVVYSCVEGKWVEIVNFSYNPFFDDYHSSTPLNHKYLVIPDPNNKNYILVKELKTEDGEFVRKTRSVKIR